jgi:hypothetical protein
MTSESTRLRAGKSIAQVFARATPQRYRKRPAVEATAGRENAFLKAKLLRARHEANKYHADSDGKANVTLLHEGVNRSNAGSVRR